MSWYVRCAMASNRTGWQELTFDSEALRGNPLGDPHERPLFVWTPPSYVTSAERRYPSVYLLQSHTGKARAWFNVSPFDREFVEVLDEELRPDAIVVLVDAFTAYGGSQFLDSLAAAFSPREDGSVDLPFDPETGEVVPEVWERWLAWDPVRLVPQHVDTLRGLRGLWIDAGRQDEYALDLGAVALRRALGAAGV